MMTKMYSDMGQRLPHYPEMPDAPHRIRYRRFKTRLPLVLENPITVTKTPPLVLTNPEIVPPPGNSVRASTSPHSTTLLMSDDFHFTF